MWQKSIFIHKISMEDIRLPLPSRMFRKAVSKSWEVPNAHVLPDAIWSCSKDSIRSTDGSPYFSMRAVCLLHIIKPRCRAINAEDRSSEYRYKILRTNIPFKIQIFRSQTYQSIFFLYELDLGLGLIWEWKKISEESMQFFEDVVHQYFVTDKQRFSICVNLRTVTSLQSKNYLSQIKRRKTFSFVAMADGYTSTQATTQKWLCSCEPVY